MGPHGPYTPIPSIRSKGRQSALLTALGLPIASPSISHHPTFIMRISSLLPILGYLAVTVAGSSALQQQQPFTGVAHQHIAQPAILESIDRYPDPVEALVNLQPGLADFLATERLVHVAGANSAIWMTEGDKLRLKRDNKFFVDITDRPDATLESGNSFAGKASACTRQRG